MSDGPKVVVEWSDRLRKDATRLRQLSDGNQASAHATFLRALERVSDLIIADPKLCFDNVRALTGNLAGVRRCKIGKRGRVFYIASADKNLAIILYFGDRKAGDSNDAYAVIERLIRSTEFDLLFAKAGIKKPAI